MVEQLFRRMKEHLGQQTPGFVAGRPRGAEFRFKVPIHVVDTTVMELVANYWTRPMKTQNKTGWRERDKSTKTNRAKAAQRDCVKRAKAAHSASAFC